LPLGALVPVQAALGDPDSVFEKLFVDALNANKRKAGLVGGKSNLSVADSEDEELIGPILKKEDPNTIIVRGGSAAGDVGGVFS
jgi:hypothetical protein